jgi:type IV pilus assembly protein PilW
MINIPTQLKRQSGLSLVELMVAMAIGLLLLAGLTLIFVNSSRASRELQLTAQQIENGRYASDILTQDLRLAGFYGHFHELPPAPGALPDPCETTDPNVLRNALALPVQGYRAPNVSTIPNVTATSCDDKGFLIASNLQPGSDVLVIRRADTGVLRRPGHVDAFGVADPNVPLGGDVAVAGAFYLQASAIQAEVQIGNGDAIGANNKADGTASTILLHDGSAPAPIRRLRTHVYFVAPCSIGTGANGTCTAADDRIPTLKRLELGAGVMQLRPLVEGIEYFKIEYGVDNLPNTVNSQTGLAGNATVDNYIASPASPDEWALIIAARVFVLARNTQQTPDFTDDKTYNLGTAVVGPADYAATNRFRRHVYTAAVRLMNTSGRREIP